MAELVKETELHRRALRSGAAMRAAGRRVGRELHDSGKEIIVPCSKDRFIWVCIRFYVCVYVRSCAKKKKKEKENGRHNMLNRSRNNKKKKETNRMLCRITKSVFTMFIFSSLA